MSNLFRKKSLDRISSPEQLNDYIRVSTPSVWLLLSAIVLLLAGVCVWGIFGHMDTTLPAVAVSQNGTVTAYIHEYDAARVTADMPVAIGDVQGRVISVSAEPLRVDDSFTDYMLHVGNLQQDEWVYAAALNADCADGIYAAQIVIDSVSPISFVLN